MSKAKHSPAKYERFEQAAAALVDVSKNLVKESKLSFTSTQRELLESVEMQSSQLLVHAKKLPSESESQERARIKNTIAKCLESISCSLEKLTENDGLPAELPQAYTEVQTLFSSVRSSHASSASLPGSSGAYNGRGQR